MKLLINVWVFDELKQDKVLTMFHKILILKFITKNTISQL